jgi:hypothetical protein
MAYLLAYATFTRGVFPFGPARSAGASRALCPHRHSGGESLYFRDVLLGFLLLLAGNLFKGF